MGVGRYLDVRLRSAEAVRRVPGGLAGAGEAAAAGSGGMARLELQLTPVTAACLTCCLEALQQ